MSEQHTIDLILQVKEEMAGAKLKAIQDKIDGLTKKIRESAVYSQRYAEAIIPKDTIAKLEKLGGLYHKMGAEARRRAENLHREGKITNGLLDDERKKLEGLVRGYSGLTREQVTRTKAGQDVNRQLRDQIKFVNALSYVVNRENKTYDR